MTRYYFKRKSNIRDLFPTIKQNKIDSKDKDIFRPIGIDVFTGEQGSGKTITLINSFLTIRETYPLAITASNIRLHNFIPISVQQYLNGELTDTKAQYIFYSDKNDYELINRHVRNGKYGVILITDEYQNYFSNQDSRNVPEWVLEQLSQNRKQRRLHLVTSQDYDQLVKTSRRRATNVIECTTHALIGSYGDVITSYWVFDAKKYNKWLDGSLKAKPNPTTKFPFYFIHSTVLRNSFDTFQVVFTGDTNTQVYNSYNQNLNITLSQPRKQSRFMRKLQAP